MLHAVSFHPMLGTSSHTRIVPPCNPRDNLHPHAYPTPTPQVHSIHLHPEPFAVENGLLTPTFKLKRPQAKAAFQEQLDAMYAEIPASAS